MESRRCQITSPDASSASTLVTKSKRLRVDHQPPMICHLPVRHSQNNPQVLHLV